MKTIITKHLLSFSISVLLLTLGFRFFGSHLLRNEWFFSHTIFLNLGYFTLMILSGIFYGKKDHEILPLIGIGLRYNLISFIIFHVTSLFWFLFDLNSKFESIDELFYSSFIWGISVLTHLYFFYISRRKNIKEIDKENLFDWMNRKEKEKSKY